MMALCDVLLVASAATAAAGRRRRLTVTLRLAAMQVGVGMAKQLRFSSRVNGKQAGAFRIRSAACYTGSSEQQSV
jgi:hypothetical protein